MKPPILVVSDGSTVASYERVEQAEGNLEAIDVLDGVFQVFDADGRALHVTAASDNGPVVIADAPDLAFEPERLSRPLRKYLEAVRSVRPELLDMTLVELSSANLDRLVSELHLVDERHRERSMANRLRRFASNVVARLHRR